MCVCIYTYIYIFPYIIGRYSHPEIQYVKIKYLDFQIIDNNRRKIRINFSTNFLLESTYIANTENKKALFKKLMGQHLYSSLDHSVPQEHKAASSATATWNINESLTLT